MSDLDKVIHDAVARKDVPFAVGMVGNAGGDAGARTLCRRSRAAISRQRRPSGSTLRA